MLRLNLPEPNASAFFVIVFRNTLNTVGAALQQQLVREIHKELTIVTKTTVVPAVPLILNINLYILESMSQTNGLVGYTFSFPLHPVPFPKIIEKICYKF